MTHKAESGITISQKRKFLSPHLTKWMYLKDVAAAHEIFSIRATDPEAKDLVDRWESMTENLNLKIYKLMT